MIHRISTNDDATTAKRTFSVPALASERNTIAKAAQSVDTPRGISDWARNTIMAAARSAGAKSACRTDVEAMAARGVSSKMRTGKHGGTRVSVLLDAADADRLEALAHDIRVPVTPMLQAVLILSAERQLARLGPNVSRETVLSPELKRQLDSLWETFCRAASAPPTAERAVFEASVRLRTRIYELGSGGGSTQRAALAREAENMAAKHRQTLYQVAGWLRVEPATVLAACEARALAATAAKTD